MPEIFLHLIPRDSSLYLQARAFRERILRLPLGLRLSERDLVGEEAQLHFVALDEAGDVVGAVVLKPLEGRVGKLRQMAVEEAARGQGIGRRLMAFAEQTAKEHGFCEIEMHARGTARGFYEKLGYAAEGEAFIEATVPHIRMRKNLE